MIETQIIFAVALSLAVFIGVWRIDSCNMLVFTPILLLMGNEFMRVMPAFIYAPLAGVSRDNFGLLVYMVGFLSIAAGFALRASLGRHNSLAPIAYLAKPIELRSEARVWAGIAVGTLVLVATGMFMYQGLPSVTQALIALAAGDEASTVARGVGESREALTKGAYFGGAYRGQGIITILHQAGWPIIAGMALMAFLRTRKWRWMLAFVVLVIASFVFIAGNGTRGPFLHTLIFYAVLYSMTQPLRGRFLAQGFVVIIAIGILTSLYSNKMQSKLAEPDAPRVLATAILERILIGNAINDVYAIDFVKNGAMDYRGGRIHFRDIQASLPGIGAPVPFAHELYLLLNYGGTATTFSTGTYITKAFVDFSVWGVALLFFGVGWMAAWFQGHLFRVPRSPLMLATATRISYEVGTLVLGGGFIALGTSVVMIILFAYSVKLGMSLLYAPRTSTPEPLPA